MKIIHTLYNWVIRKAETPAAEKTLAVVAFSESSFFPIPPDIMLIPMVIANKVKAWRFAAIASVSSVLGGLFGYAIGYFFYETVGQWIISTYHLEEAFQRFHDEFQVWGTWVILVKGLTPIPYKLVTIAAGIAHFDLFSFVWASIVTRAGRFFLVATLLYFFGPPIRVFVEKYLVWCTFALLALVVFGFWVVLG